MLKEIINFLFKRRHPGTLFGVPIYLDPSWFLVTYLILFLNPTLIFGWLLITTIILAHEFGHVYGAWRCGIKTEDISMMCMGGMAKMERMPKEPTQELFVTICGPAVNMILAGICLPFINHSGPLGEIATSLCEINLWIFAFNVFIPAIPMDGGRLLRATLSLFISRLKATYIAMYIAKFLAIGMGLLGIYMFDPFLIIIGIVIYFASANEYKQAWTDNAKESGRSGDML